MRYLSRELAGWILILIGLYVFSQSYRLLTSESHQIIEGGSLSVVGIIIFRGGIHLLKIAVAAQVCSETQEAITRQQTTPRSPAAGNRPQRISVG